MEGSMEGSRRRKKEKKEDRAEEEGEEEDERIGAEGGVLKKTEDIREEKSGEGNKMLEDMSSNIMKA